MSVFLYISGHGFGHAVRQIEILDTLAARKPSLPIVVRTSAPRWLFERAARGRYTLLEGEVDTGVVQRDSLTPDEAETIRRAAAFHDDLERRAADEAGLLRRHGARIVVADAPPLACAAAAQAGIPAAVCGNFTWDWIYASYAEHLARFPTLLARVRDAYARASAGWRMPMHGGFETISPIVDVPFVVRQPRPESTRDAVRRALDLPLAAPLALVSFGGYGLADLPLDRLDCAPDWGIVVTRNQTSAFLSARGAPPPLALARRLRASLGPQALSPSVFAARRVFVLPDDQIYSAGLRYEDLIRAVDVVITKPGYGIISDCLANGTAMLYTARGRFAEYDVLVREMPRYLRCRYIDGDDLRAGRWRTALDALIAAPAPPETPRLDGARVVADLIAERC